MKHKLALHRHHQAFLAFAGLLFLGSAAGSWYTWKECQGLDEDAAQLTEQVNGAKKKIAAIEDLENDVIVLRENVAAYLRILPGDAEANDFYRTMDGFLRDAEITVDVVKPLTNRVKLSTSALFERAEYSLKFAATFRQFLQFISRLENHERFVSIADVKLKAGERDPKSDAEPLHGVDLTIVTYVYLGDDVGKGMTIPGYDKKRDRLQDRIVEARDELALDRFQLLSDTVVRRDPLVDPRARRGKGAPGGPGAPDQRAQVSRILARLEEANSVLDLMGGTANVIRKMELKVQAISTVAELQVEADQVAGHGGIADAALKRDWEKKVLPELAKLRARVGGEEVGGGGTTAGGIALRLEQALSAMQQQWQLGDYAGCVKGYELVHTIGAAESADPKVVDLQSKMEGLYLAAQTAVEFGKKKLAVSGLIVDPKAESVAIINHTVYRVGESIEDDLVLLEIHEDRLVFEFRGVPLTFDL